MGLELYSTKVGEFPAGVRVVQHQGWMSSLLGLELYKTKVG